MRKTIYKPKAKEVTKLKTYLSSYKDSDTFKQLPKQLKRLI